MALGLAFRQRRRIEDHQVEGAHRTVGEPLEGIALHLVVRHGADPRVVVVQREVALGRCERVGRQVEVGHRLRAAASRVEAEPAGEAERVQHLRPGRQGPDDPAVVALVEEEPGLLPADDVGLEPQAGFAEHHDRTRRLLARRRGAAELRAVLEADQARRFLAVPAQAQDQAGRLEHRLDHRCQLRHAGQPHGRVELEHQGVGVAVEHETRPTIALAVDEPEAVGVRSDGLRCAARHRGVEPRAPPRRIDSDRLAGVEDPDADGRTGIEEADGEELVAPVVDDRELARLGVAVLLAQGVAVDPRMAAADDGFRRRGDAEAETGLGDGRRHRREDDRPRPPRRGPLCKRDRGECNPGFVEGCGVHSASRRLASH